MQNLTKKGIKDLPLNPSLEKGPSTNATARAKYPLSSNKSIPTNKIYTWGTNTRKEPIPVITPLAKKSEPTDPAGLTDNTQSAK